MRTHLEHSLCHGAALAALLLGASTAEATDRAGYQAAEQVAAALTGGLVTSAVNVPAVRPEDLSATLFHLLGIDPHTEVRDPLNRPLPISTGSVIAGILA